MSTKKSPAVKPARRTNGAKRAIAAAVESINKETAAPRPKSLLELAHAAVHGERQENYGSQHDNFQRIADRMTITLQDKLVAPITVQDVALLQIDVKLGRLANTGGTHRDSIVDIAGYAECLDIVNQTEDQRDTDAR